MPPRKRAASNSTATRSTRGKRPRLSELREVGADTHATHQHVPTPAPQGNLGQVSIDVNALSTTTSTVVAQAVQSTLSQNNIAAILTPRTTDGLGCIEPAVASATDAIVVDSGSSEGHEVQGNITRRGQIPNSRTREPNAEELVSNLSGLLSAALTDGSRRLYQRAWAVFRQFYAQFYGSAQLTLPLLPTCTPLFISYLSFRKLSFSTITSYLSAISYVHKLRGFPDPTKSFLIQKLLTALSRQRSADVCLPVTRPVLHELIRSLSFTNSSAFQR